MRIKSILIIALMAFASSCTAMSLVDKYGNVKAGDWVWLELTNGTKQLLFVAAKGDKTVTIEAKEYDRDFLVSWRQIVIDLANKKTILVRDKDPVSGAVKEREPTDEEKIDAVLQSEFREIGDEKISQTIEIKDENTLKYKSVRKTFDCTLYRSVVEDRYVEIWCYDDIPLYPVKANIPGLGTTIKLVRYGTGKESSFQPKDKAEKNKE